MRAAYSPLEVYVTEVREDGPSDPQLDSAKFKEMRRGERMQRHPSRAPLDSQDSCAVS